MQNNALRSNAPYFRPVDCGDSALCGVPLLLTELATSWSPLARPHQLGPASWAAMRDTVTRDDKFCATTVL
jgi:hypothetical protein